MYLCIAYRCSIFLPYVLTLWSLFVYPKMIYTKAQHPPPLTSNKPKHCALICLRFKLKQQRCCKASCKKKRKEHKNYKTDIVQILQLRQSHGNWAKAKTFVCLTYKYTTETTMEIYRVIEKSRESMFFSARLPFYTKTSSCFILYR